MMSDPNVEAQIQRRMPIMEFLTKGYAEVEGIVIGFGLMIEYIDVAGQRGIHKLTSDASGKPLPDYIVQGISSALEYLDEFDTDVREDDE